MEKSRERIREDEERYALFHTFQNGLNFAETEVKKWITDPRNSRICVSTELITFASEKHTASLFR